MDEFGKWVLLNADKIPAFGLFLAGFAVLMIALYREWIVFGGPYRKCMARVEAFELQATERAQANEVKTTRLEEAFETFKRESERQIDRLESENERLREQQGRRR